MTPPLFVPVACLLLYFGALAWFGLNRPCWHDECHFAETVRLFKAAPTLATLRHYNEMSTPLPFMLYAAWGAVAGDSLPRLRVLSLIIAFFTYAAFHYLFSRVLSRPRAAFGATLFLALHPYMIGAGIFVFTDMLSMLFLALLLIAVRKENRWLACAASTSGLLCRQYFVFVTIAAIAFNMRRFGIGKKRQDIYAALLLAASLLPVAALFVFWNGPSPDCTLRRLYLTTGPVYHPNALTLYLLQAFAYMLPLILFRVKSIYRANMPLLLAFLFCWIYWLFPVAPSECAVAVNKFTVGYLHRLLRVFPGERFEHAVFFLCFAAALPLLFSLAKDFMLQIRTRSTGFPLFLNLSMAAFFATMPFSYLTWEKYFLPMLPILAMQILSFGRQEKG